ncbi:MAG: class I SAM-dependent rRNA methyltransferase [Planctomycetaceae bacterium]
MSAEPSSTECAAAASDSVRVFLKKRKAQPFFGRHPWVFAGAIDRIETEGQGTDGILPGTPAELWSHEGRFIAHGLVNPHSNIRMRLYSWEQARPIGTDLFRDRIRYAVELRRGLFDLRSDSTGCRLIFSESDQLSGLTVDLYSGFLLVQFTSLALYEHRQPILESLTAELSPRGIWLRTEKGMREAERLEAVDGLIAGEEPPRPLFIEEHGVQYGVDVQQGQKTGSYLDQRDNRLAAARYTSGHRVLDAFCFSGGFGITAVKLGGAVSVLGLDSSESALTLASANAELNSVADRCEFRRGDVHEVLAELAEQGRVFDTVILDPPRMARTRGGLPRAIKGYLRLNTAALRVLRPGGMLVTCSCSGLLPMTDFQEVVGEVSRSTGRTIQVLEKRTQPADHPVAVTCPESEYLKMLICRVD